MTESIRQYARILNTVERSRVAVANRLRSLPPTDQEALAGVVDALKDEESFVASLLVNAVNDSPYAEFVARHRGIGAKQLGRFVGAIGSDIHWNPIRDRPRSLRELWAYCGLHTQGGVAVVPAERGRANWSSEAKIRVVRMAIQVLKRGQPGDYYRDIYYFRRTETSRRLHQAPCASCGVGQGKPWSPRHQHFDALRITAKEIARGVWIESRKANGLPVTE